MGNCSITPVYDKVAKVVLLMDIPEICKHDILKALIDAMEDQDWDCQDDSLFSGEPMFEAIRRELHPDDYDDDEEMECPDCGAIWGIDEIMRGMCYSCGYPNNAITLGDDDSDRYDLTE